MNDLVKGRFMESLMRTARFNSDKEEGQTGDSTQLKDNGSFYNQEEKISNQLNLMDISIEGPSTHNLSIANN